jgi:hypothetical protein
MCFEAGWGVGGGEDGGMLSAQNCTDFDAKGSAKWRELPSFLELVGGQSGEYRGRQFGSDSSVYLLCVLCSHEE